jgi:hypothetical protein
MSRLLVVNKTYGSNQNPRARADSIQDSRFLQRGHGQDIIRRNLAVFFHLKALSEPKFM